MKFIALTFIVIALVLSSCDTTSSTNGQADIDEAERIADVSLDFIEENVVWHAELMDILGFSREEAECEDLQKLESGGSDHRNFFEIIATDVEGNTYELIMEVETAEIGDSTEITVKLTGIYNDVIDWEFYELIKQFRDGFIIWNMYAKLTIPAVGDEPVYEALWERAPVGEDQFLDMMFYGDPDLVVRWNNPQPLSTYDSIPPEIDEVVEIIQSHGGSYEVNSIRRATVGALVGIVFPDDKEDIFGQFGEEDDIEDIICTVGSMLGNCVGGPWGTLICYVANKCAIASCD